MRSPMKLHTKIRLTLTVIIFLTSVAAYAAEDENKNFAPYPNPDRGYVTDIANALTSEQEEEMESWLYTTEKRTGFEIAVVIIDSIKDYKGTANGSIESFATGLFDKYGIGNMPDNNGVLLVVAIKDRKARIELGAGYGRRRDSDANRIMQNVIIPQFRKDKYDAGIMKGTKAILAEFASVRIFPGWIKLVVVFAIIAMIPITISLFRNGKRGWGWVCAGLIIVLLLVLLRFAQNTLESLPKDSGAGGFGGGFGGGFSGGGGATGSW